MNFSASPVRRPLASLSVPFPRRSRATRQVRGWMCVEDPRHVDATKRSLRLEILPHFSVTSACVLRFGDCCRSSECGTGHIGRGSGVSLQRPNRRQSKVRSCAVYASLVYAKSPPRCSAPRTISWEFRNPWTTLYSIMRCSCGLRTEMSCWSHFFAMRGTEQSQALTLLKLCGYCHGSGASWFSCKQIEG